jgi:hypothetical protein
MARASPELDEGRRLEGRTIVSRRQGTAKTPRNFPWRLCVLAVSLESVMATALPSGDGAAGRSGASRAINSRPGAGSTRGQHLLPAARVSQTLKEGPSASFAAARSNTSLVTSSAGFSTASAHSFEWFCLTWSNWFPLGEIGGNEIMLIPPTWQFHRAAG